MNKKILVFVLFFSFVMPFQVFAAKSPKPQITEIAGAFTPNVRVHFKINPVQAGQIIKVRYSLKTRKLGDIKYKIPKKAKRKGIVNSATSRTGSAIDLNGLPSNSGKFIYEFRVKIKIPGKKWSTWSNIYST